MMVFSEKHALCIKNAFLFIIQINHVCIYLIVLKIGQLTNNLHEKIHRSVYYNRLDNKNGVVTKADAFYNNSIIILLFIHSV